MLYDQLKFTQTFGSQSQHQVAVGDWAAASFYPCIP